MVRCEDRKVGVNQCDQIGRFLKILADKFSFKRSQNILSVLGLFWKQHFLSKKCCGYFLGNFWWYLGYFLVQRLVALLGWMNDLHWTLESHLGSLVSFLYLSLSHLFVWLLSRTLSATQPLSLSSSLSLFLSLSLPHSLTLPLSLSTSLSLSPDVPCSKYPRVTLFYVL